MTIICRVARVVNHESWIGRHLSIKLMRELCASTVSTVLQDISQDLKVEVSTFFAGDIEIAEYNRLYRNKPNPTNVLSFSTIELEKASDILNHIESVNGYFCLGDIMFSYDTIYRESIEQNKKTTNHMMHLFVHSVLHLLGFDHETQDERIEMERIECGILGNFGVHNIYE